MSKPPASGPDCLSALLQASGEEIYLADAASLRIVDANPAACLNLGLDLSTLQVLRLSALAPRLAAGVFADLSGEQALRLQTSLQRPDGSQYPVRLRLQRTVLDGRNLILAVATDLSAQKADAAALEHYRKRFDAIVSHTPGLVYQFVLHSDGSVAFPYLSEGCQALLGLSAAELEQQPGLFLDLILPEDRRSYLDAMHLSSTSLKAWNWEGRIWIDAWKDVKWINLRSTPHGQADASVRWEGIMSNITESKVQQQQVRQSRASLAELSAHTDKVKEQERSRIAREIHDDLGGNLTAIKMGLAMLADRLPPGPVAEKAAYVDSLVDRSIDAVHRISLDLRPAMLDLGIVAALEWQIREFEKHMGVACSFQCSAAEIELDADHATALFRIFQEALTNIAKHARASRVAVRLDRRRHHISLKITDNGAGIAPADKLKPRSFGIRGMHERAAALGGTLSLADAPGGGTVVTIKTKLAKPEGAIIGAPGASA